ncbi:MAG: hypothetical protein LKG38_02670, partial [Atopobiaceae bacterium]|nr:hypothetical protein [Atopobiaceae bacterium]
AQKNAEDKPDDQEGILNMLVEYCSQYEQDNRTNEHAGYQERAPLYHCTEMPLPCTSRENSNEA